ncbi:hypothetical protein QZH41_005480 [Actinostola sp. cb2023]|nr:hypothetical protein QZH41_005480 [Actinostola sp. cb2023]
MFYDGYWFEGSMASSVLYMLAAVFTVTGNLLVFVTFIKDPYGQLRKRRNCFLVNLAISDILMGAFVIPLLAIAFWAKAEDLLFAHYIIAVVSGSSSLLNLTALSIIRYYALKDPFGYESLITYKRAILGVIGIWLQSIHLALLPVLGWTSPSYQLYLYGVGFTLPSVFIFLAYYGVFRRMRKYTRGIVATVSKTDLAKRSAYYIDNDDGTKSHVQSTQSVRIRKAVEREKRVTKTLVIVMSVFVLSWLPMLFLDVLLVQFPSCRSWSQIHLARDISLTLTYFSSGINPILYTLRIRQFRVAVLKLIRVASADFSNSSFNQQGPKRVAKTSTV